MNNDNPDYDWCNDFPIIRVLYYDHCWVEKDTPERVLEKSVPIFLHEMGYLLKETDTYLVMCKNMVFDSQHKQWQFDGTFVVMKAELKKSYEIIKEKNG